MLGFLLGAQRPPKSRRIKDGVVMRLDHVYEIDPARMEIFPQQQMPVWDTLRIVKNRWEHLAWMQDHFADKRISGEELEKEIEKEEKKHAAKSKGSKSKKR